MIHSIALDKDEWDRVLALMSYAPGRECIPLMNKIGAQLVRQGNSRIQETPAAEGQFETKQ